jgi:DNA-binding winged helix-turn-helix (wHTH) protein
MSSEQFSFGPFTLDAERWRLTRVDNSQDIHLGKKAFQILIELVRQENRVVLREQLRKKVWNDDWVEDRTLTTHVSSIRKALDDDEKHPTYIRTIHGVGFQFIAAINGTTGNRPATVPPSALSHEEDFEVTTHHFVPFYIGPNLEIGTQRKTAWGNHLESDYESAKLFIGPYGVGVWDVHCKLRFKNLSELAHWRRTSYDALLAGNHEIRGITSDLVRRYPCSQSDLLFGYAGRFQYVLSVYELNEHAWSASQLKPALKLLACPKMLLHGPSPNHIGEEGYESRLLRDDFHHRDLREFGVLGTHLGYAGWSGVSYFGFGKQQPVLCNVLIGFQTALQSLWLYSYLLKDLASRQKVGSKSAWEAAFNVTSSEFSRIHAIGATESVDERTMREAILETSRLESLVKGTLGVLKKSIKA